MSEGAGTVKEVKVRGHDFIEFTDLELTAVVNRLKWPNDFLILIEELLVFYTIHCHTIQATFQSFETLSLALYFDSFCIEALTDPFAKR